MLHKDTFNKNKIFDGAKGPVFIGDKILTCRRDNRTPDSPLLIDLPGGGREGNESPFDTFKRELFEEFGLNVSKENIVYCVSHQSIKNPSLESFFFVAKLPDSEKKNIVFGDEGTEFLLLDLDEYLSRTDVINRHQARIRDYLFTLKNI